MFEEALLGSVTAPLLISDSDFGSEQIVPAAPVLALHPCITYTFWHEKHSKLKHLSRSNRVSLFALEYTWHCSLAFRRRNASEKCQVYYNGNSETGDVIWTRVMLCFYLFSDGENHLSIGSMVQRYLQEWLRKASRSVRSVARSVVDRVGRLCRSSW